MRRQERSAKIVFILSLIFGIQMSFTSCQKPISGSNITIMGNPNNDDNQYDTKLSIAAYDKDTAAGSLDSLEMCFDRLTLQPVEAGSALVRVQFESNQAKAVSENGTQLGSLKIPPGEYSQIYLEISAWCASQASLGLINSQGSFTTAQTVLLNFTGQVQIDPFKGLIFAIQPIIDNLNTVASDNDVAAQASSSPGQVYASNTWSPMGAVGAPAARVNATSIWTGRHLLVWGGDGAGGLLNNGGRFDPATNTWLPVSTGANAPAANAGPAIAWTGSELIMWGGRQLTFSDARRYNPDTDSWAQISVTNAPPMVHSAASVWTGSEMLVWGGTDGGLAQRTGGRYNPSTNTWAPITTVNAPTARYFNEHQSAAVWTGTEMIVWGGETQGPMPVTGGRYNPATNSWRPTSTVGAPSGRYGFTPIWTGSEMIVWGGREAGPKGDGALYNPVTDTWRPVSAVGAPVRRTSYSAVWTGSKMIVWGGIGGAAWDNLSDGFSYDPSTNSWTPISLAGGLSARLGASAVWTGSQALIWGGWNSTSDTLFSSGGIYNP